MRFSIVRWSVFSFLLLSGCSDARDSLAGALDEELQRAAQEAAEAPPAANSPPAAALELEQVTVADMGVTIRVPRGSTVLAASEMSTTYSLVLEGGMNEINVQVRGIGETQLARAREDATMLGGEVQEAKEENGRIELVMAPVAGLIQRVNVYTRDKSTVCSGPPENLALLREICNSVAPAP
jgi:hypothetical protein